MATIEQVEWQFKVVDQASKAMSGIVGAAEKLENKLKGVTDLLSAAGGFAGMFAIGSSVAGINQTYEAVLRLKSATGLAAEDAHSMLDAFELSGVEGGEQIIERMTMKIQKMGATGGKSAAKMGAAMRKFGTDDAQSAVDVMMDLSTAAQKGTLNLNDLRESFGMSGQQAIKMQQMLARGPERMKALMDGTLASGDLITEQALASFQAMKDSKLALKDSWDGLVGTLYKSVVPMITSAMTKIGGMLDRLQPKIDKMAAFLHDHMEQIVGLAATFVKLMTANKLTRMVTGQGLGSLAAGFLAKKGGAAGKIGEMMGGGVQKVFVANWPGSMKVGGGLLGATSAGGGLGGMLGGGAKEVGDAFGKGPSVIAKVAGAFGGLLTSLPMVAMVVYTLSQHFGAFASVIARLAPVAMQVGAALGRIFDAAKPIIDLAADIIGGILLVAVNAIATAIEGILLFARAIGYYMANITTIGYDLASAFGDAQGDVDAERSQQQALRERANLKEANANRDRAKADALKGSGAPSTNFINNKFDIKQEFAEGFDHDRIAVAFASDLSQIGERKLQSAYAPLGSVR